MDLLSMFDYLNHKYKLQYNFSNYRQHIVQNVYQYWYYDSLNTTHQYGEFGFDYSTFDRTSYEKRGISPDYIGTTQWLWAIIAGVYL